MAPLCRNMAFTLKGAGSKQMVARYGSELCHGGGFCELFGAFEGIKTGIPGMPVLGEARALAQDHLVTARADGRPWAPARPAGLRCST